MRLVLLTTGLFCGFVVGMSGCAPRRVSLSAGEQRAVLTTAHTIIVAANRGDLHGVEQRMWPKSFDYLVLKHALRVDERYPGVVRKWFPNWRHMRIAEHSSGGSLAIRLYVISPSSSAYYLLMVQTTSSTNKDIAEKARRGRLANRVVFVPLSSGDRTYYLPMLEVAPQDWQAMTIPDTLGRDDIMGYDDLHPIDVPYHRQRDALHKSTNARARTCPLQAR